MKISSLKKLKNKELIVFDLDGTIVPSKFTMDSEMVELFKNLLEKKSVAVISGGELKQFKIQFLDVLKKRKGVNYQNLFLFPTCSSIFYKYYKNRWNLVYAHYLSSAQIQKIRKAFKQAYKEINYKDPERIYGPVLGNRRTQVSFSALGQNVVRVLGRRGVAMKELWRKNNDVRPALARVLMKLLPDFEVKIGGVTTIDITKKGVDKAYGLRQMQKYLKVPINKMLFVGDAIFPGGNDYPAVKTGVDYIPVKNPEETKKIIRAIIKV